MSEPNASAGSRIASLNSEIEEDQRRENGLRRIANEARQRNEERTLRRDQATKQFDVLIEFTNLAIKEAHLIEQIREVNPAYLEKRRDLDSPTDTIRQLASLFATLGTMLCKFDTEIDGLWFIETLQEAAQKKGAIAFKYACELLLLGSKGEVDTLILALERAAKNEALGKLAGWSPFIRDRLLWPFPLMVNSPYESQLPSGTTLEEIKLAKKALTVPERLFHTPDQWDNILKERERWRTQLEAASSSERSIAREDLAAKTNRNGEGEREGQPVGAAETPNRRGRPKLRESNREEATAILNVYDLIRTVKLKNAGWSRKALFAHFRGKKDFKDLVKKGGRTCELSLFQSALEYIKNNPAPVI